MRQAMRIGRNLLSWKSKDDRSIVMNVAGPVPVELPLTAKHSSKDFANVSAIGIPLGGRNAFERLKSGELLQEKAFESIKRSRREVETMRNLRRQNFQIFERCWHVLKPGIEHLEVFGGRVARRFHWWGRRIEGATYHLNRPCRHPFPSKSGPSGRESRAAGVGPFLRSSALRSVISPSGPMRETALSGRRACFSLRSYGRAAQRNSSRTLSPMSMLMLKRASLFLPVRIMWLSFSP